MHHAFPTYMVCTSYINVPQLLARPRPPTSFMHTQNCWVRLLDGGVQLVINLRFCCHPNYHPWCVASEPATRKCTSHVRGPDAGNSATLQLPHAIVKATTNINLG